MRAIATVLAVGAVVALVAVTGGAALGVALAVGAVVAGVGSAAAAVTYMRDKENSTASSMGTYIRNSGTASLITAFVIGTFWAAPYAGEALAMMETGGLPFTMVFGNFITVGELAEWMTIGTQGLALLNAFFQTNELLAFFGGMKELGEPTGCAVYDDVKMLTEAYNMEFLLMGLGQWLKERALRRPRNAGGSRKSKIGGKKAGTGTSAKGLIGHDFEDYLTETLGGEGSFKVGGREFDGRVGNRWWEAKSGNYWNMLEEKSRELANFKSSMGDRLRIANENGATLELFSNTPIPEAIKQWLIKKGIPFTEILN